MPAERPENEPLTQPEMAAMSREIHDLRLRAEHALLTGLARVTEGGGYPSSCSAENAAHLARALADLRASQR